MSYINVHTMDREAFGQVAENICFKEVDPPYSEAVRTEVMSRLEQEVRVGPVVGRNVVFQIVHDGEVGPHMVAMPRVAEVSDPIVDPRGIIA